MATGSLRASPRIQLARLARRALAQLLAVAARSGAKHHGLTVGRPQGPPVPRSRAAHMSAGAEPSRIDVQRALGAYYTPADIAEVITKWSVRDNAGPLLDPSYGVCRFLEAGISALRNEGRADAVRLVHGIDVDKEATAATTARLLMRGAHDQQFQHLDFFEVPPEPHFAAVVGNPP